MGFIEPAALLLAVPLAWLLWRTHSGQRGATALRAVVLGLLVLALAGPFLPIGRPGRDLVLVVDRSRSMPTDVDERALELVRLAEAARDSGDRLGLVAFGRDASVEQVPLEEGTFGGFQQVVDPDGSDLAGALELAMGIVPEGRPGTLLVLTDGAATTDLPPGLAQRAAARGLSIDVRELAREGSTDLSIERIELPESVGEGEPFQFSVWVRASRAVEREFRLVREGRELSSGLRSFQPGLNRLVFRDVLERGGVAEYAVELAVDDDSTPENNRGVGAVLAQGAPRVLLLAEGEGPSTLAQALLARGVQLDVRRPQDVRLTPIALSAYRAVVLENVDAGLVGLAGLEALADFVDRRGGGLLLTGGTASFGRGGYHRSPIDELLPVSMELRQEHRKQAVALSIVMDRSGSMSMPVDSSRSKMDLANAGAAAAIETLGPFDSISVLAVDTEAHVVQSQIALESPGPLLAKVRRIESTGGGIYCHSGLVAAIRQLSDEERLTKHIILFADAADADEQEGCFELVADARRGGVTCSVIALGTRLDQHASFLEGLARIGGGTVAFTTSPTDLPRLFAQETLTVARANFVEEATGTRALPGLLGLGDLPAESFPPLGGYNLTYLRPNATAAVVTTDEYAAPVLAFAYRGLGRVAAYTGQVGGRYGAPLATWDQFSGFATGLVRWLLGTEEPGGLFPSVVREGSQARFVLEVDQGAPIPAQLGALRATALMPDGSTQDLAFERVDGNRFEARLDLEGTGTVLATVALPGGTAFALPPASLPYSPEFETQGTVGSRRALVDLALGSGGRVLASAGEFYEGERGDLGSRPLHRELVLAALLLALLEIALRRLSLWSALAAWSARWRALVARRAVAAPAGASGPASDVPGNASVDAAARARAAARRTQAGAATGGAAPTSSADVATPRAADDPVAPAARPEASRGEPTELGDALARARERARGRLDRGDGSNR